jgi:hypothetical protein
MYIFIRLFFLASFSQAGSGLVPLGGFCRENSSKAAFSVLPAHGAAFIHSIFILLSGGFSII